MQRLWVGDVIVDPSQGHKAGVIILINRGLNCDVSGVVNEGRKVSVCLTSPTMDIRVMAVHAPNSPTSVFFQNWCLDWPMFCMISILLGGLHS